MIPNTQEVQDQVLSLLENESGQKQMDRMVSALQQRVLSYDGQTLGIQELNKMVWQVYTQQTRQLRQKSLSALKPLGKLLQQRRWESPNIALDKK
jgi:hypothetical protein